MLTCPYGHGESATGGQSCSVCGSALTESAPVAATPPPPPEPPAPPASYLPPVYGTSAPAPPPYGTPAGYGYGPPPGSYSPPSSMGMGDAVRSVLGKYADFSGRARRAEYWWWALATFLTMIVVLILGLFILPLLILYVVVAIGTVIPTLAVSVRRLHDTDKSGWWFFITLVPFVGGIILLVFYVTEGTPGPNRYGAAPR